jgi:hypothetical protein
MAKPEFDECFFHANVGYHGFKYRTVSYIREECKGCGYFRVIGACGDCYKSIVSCIERNKQGKGVKVNICPSCKMAWFHSDYYTLMGG